MFLGGIMFLFTFAFTMTFPVSCELSKQRVISILFFIKFKNRYHILIKSEFLLSQNSKRYLELDRRLCGRT